MKKLMITLPFIFSSFSGHGQNSDKFTGSLLWKITGNGLEAPSYIYGTFHMGEASLAQTYPGFNEALESCTQVAGEIDMVQMKDPIGMQAIMMKYLTMPADTSYADLLSEEELKRVDEGLKSYLGTGLDQLGRIKPAGLTTFTIPQKMFMECLPDLDFHNFISMDQYVQDYARSTEKKILALESIEDQFNSIFYAESLSKQTETLLCTVNGVLEAKMNNVLFGAENLHKTMELYKAGDLYGLYTIILEDPDGGCRMSEQMAISINQNRNNNWLEKLPGIFADGPTFVAVGALHLCGQEGLLFGLDALGYQVEAVK